MHRRQFLLRAFLAAGVWVAAASNASATEYALSTYGLGGNAFGAGTTPPPGTYVTEATAFYNGNIGTTVGLEASSSTQVSSWTYFGRNQHSVCAREKGPRRQPWTVRHSSCGSH